MTKLLQILAVGMALLLALGELARRWNDPHLIPLALDELGVAAALLAGAWRSRRHGMAALAAGWGLFCGLVLVLLAANANYPLHGLPKPGGVFYSLVLGAMLLLGGWACWQALRLAERRA